MQNVKKWGWLKRSARYCMLVVITGSLQSGIFPGSLKAAVEIPPQRSSLCHGMPCRRGGEDQIYKVKKKRLDLFKKTVTKGQNSKNRSNRNRGTNKPDMNNNNLNRP